ncbi:MAG: type 4a pilus biogenesis protein PilO [Acidimicrobiales bacterium]
MNEQLDQLAVAVPVSPDVAGFVRLVDVLADESDAVVSSVTPQAEQPSTASAGVEVTSVSMTLQGTYPEVMSFIERLLTADRLVEVRSVDLTSDTAAGALFVDLTVAIFSEPGSGAARSELVGDTAVGITLEAAG